jgi:hypothetical protein
VVEGDLPRLEVAAEVEMEVEVAVMNHHPLTTMALLQGRQHELPTPPPEAVEQDKNNGDLAFGLALSVELPLDIWLGTEIDPVNQRLNRGAEDCSVLEQAIPEAAAGLEEAMVMLARAARGHPAPVRQLHHQVGIPAPVSVPRSEGRSTDILR